MIEKYSGNWANIDDVRSSFGVKVGYEDFPSEEEMLLAIYNYEDYAGYAFVLYRRNGILHEVNGSHCSCDGLVGQWVPEETSIDSLRMRNFLSGFPAEMKRMVEEAASSRPWPQTW